MFRQGINWPLIWHEMSRRAERGEVLGPHHVGAVVAALAFASFMGFEIGNLPLSEALPFGFYAIGCTWAAYIVFSETAARLSVGLLRDLDRGTIPISVMAHGSPLGVVLYWTIPELATLMMRMLRPFAFIVLAGVGGFVSWDAFVPFVMAVFSVSLLAFFLMLVLTVWLRNASAASSLSVLLVLAVLFVGTGEILNVLRAPLSIDRVVLRIAESCVSFLTPRFWSGKWPFLLWAALAAVPLGVLPSVIIVRRRMNGGLSPLARFRTRKRLLPNLSVAAVSLSGLSPLDNGLYRLGATLLFMCFGLLPVIGFPLLIVFLPQLLLSIFLRARAEMRFDHLLLALAYPRRFAQLVFVLMVWHIRFALPGLFVFFLFGRSQFTFFDALNGVTFGEALLAQLPVPLAAAHWFAWLMVMTGACVVLLAYLAMSVLDIATNNMYVRDMAAWNRIIRPSAVAIGLYFVFTVAAVVYGPGPQGDPLLQLWQVTAPLIAWATVLGMLAVSGWLRFVDMVAYHMCSDPPTSADVAVLQRLLPVRRRRRRVWE